MSNIQPTGVQAKEGLSMVTALRDINQLAGARSTWTDKLMWNLKAVLGTTVETPVIIVRRTGMLLADISQAIVTHTVGVISDMSNTYRVTYLTEVIRAYPEVVEEVLSHMIEGVTKAELEMLVVTLTREQLASLIKMRRLKIVSDAEPEAEHIETERVVTDNPTTQEHTVTEKIIRTPSVVSAIKDGPVKTYRPGENRIEDSRMDDDSRYNAPSAVDRHEPEHKEPEPLPNVSVRPGMDAVQDRLKSGLKVAAGKLQDSMKNINLPALMDQLRADGLSDEEVQKQVNAQMIEHVTKNSQ